MSKIEIPQPPLSRLVREGTVGTCPICGSTEIYEYNFFMFHWGKKIGCIQKTCTNYYLGQGVQPLTEGRKKANWKNIVAKKSKLPPPPVKRSKSYSRADLEWAFNSGIYEGGLRIYYMKQMELFSPSDLDYYLKLRQI